MWNQSPQKWTQPKNYLCRDRRKGKDKKGRGLKGGNKGDCRVESQASKWTPLPNFALDSTKDVKSGCNAKQSKFPVPAQAPGGLAQPGTGDLGIGWVGTGQVSPGQSWDLATHISREGRSRMSLSPGLLRVLLPLHGQAVLRTKGTNKPTGLLSLRIRKAKA